MGIQHIHRLKWILTILILVSIAVGCTGRLSTPEQNSITAESPSTAIVATTPSATLTEILAMVTPTSGPAQISEPSADDVQYEDDFTKPSSGWPAAKYDNYFIGYHEPDYYHVALQSPNSRTTVFIPEKPSYNDATVDVKVFTDPNNTATEGDFRYGTVFQNLDAGRNAKEVCNQGKAFVGLVRVGRQAQVHQR